MTIIRAGNPFLTTFQQFRAIPHLGGLRGSLRPLDSIDVAGRKIALGMCEAQPLRRGSIPHSSHRKC